MGLTILLTGNKGAMDEQQANGREMKPLSPQEKVEMKLNIYKNIQQTATSGGFRYFPGGKNSWLPRTVAAAVLFAFAVTAYFWRRPATVAESTIGYVAAEVSTGRGEMKKIILQDSTVVMLNAASTLRYAAKARGAAVREVELKGNAFFSVHKDRLHSPFVVHAGALAVTVLGTELNVNARTAGVEVELASGKVKVEQTGNNNGTVYLRPGEKIKFNPDNGVFLKAAINPQLYDAWTRDKWNFRQSSLEEIGTLIHEYYGVDILFEKEQSRHLRISAVLPVSNLASLVAVVERTVHVNMEIKNNQLIVQ